MTRPPHCEIELKRSNLTKTSPSLPNSTCHKKLRLER